MDRIVVVGGGVLGAMHAVLARRLGHKVMPREVPRAVREHLLATAGPRRAGLPTRFFRAATAAGSEIRGLAPACRSPRRSWPATART